MDFTIDNNKSSEIDNVTQTLLSNANGDTKLKTDDANGLFDVTGNHHHHHQINDGLNNIIGLHHTSGENLFSDIVMAKGATEHDLFLSGSGGMDKEHMIMINAEKACMLETECDMGPETSVDTTDDVDIDTDPCSTLSHSKETIPSSSDNPFDLKFADQEFDHDDVAVQQQQKPPTPPLIRNNQMTFGTGFADTMQMHEGEHFDEFHPSAPEIMEDVKHETGFAVTMQMHGGEQFNDFHTPAQRLMEDEKLAFLEEEDEEDSEVHAKTDRKIDELKDNEISSLEFIGGEHEMDIDRPAHTGDIVNEVVGKIETTIVETINKGFDDIIEEKDDFPEKELTQFTEQVTTVVTEIITHPDMIEKDEHSMEHDSHEFKEDDETKSVSPAPGDYPDDHSDDSIQHIEDHMEHNEEMHEPKMDKLNFEQQQQFSEMHAEEEHKLDEPIHLEKANEDHQIDHVDPTDDRFENDLLNESFTAKEMADIMESQNAINEPQEHERYLNESTDLFETEHQQIENNLVNILSSNDGNMQYEFEQHKEEPVIKTDNLELLESASEPHIEAENMANEEKELEVKDPVTENFEQFKTNELESAAAAFEQESCDESLDEWKYIKTKGEDQTGEIEKIVEQHIDVVEATATTKHDVPEPELEKLYHHYEEQEEPPQQQQQQQLQQHGEPEGLPQQQQQHEHHVTNESQQSEDLIAKKESDTEKSLECFEKVENVAECESSKLSPPQSPSPSSSPLQAEINSSGNNDSKPIEAISHEEEKKVEGEDDDDMNSQLNPEAQEFVPSSSPISFEIKNSFLLTSQCLNGDEIIAQSPQKPLVFSMDSIEIPPKTQFDREIANRPAEMDIGDNLQRPGLNLGPIMPGLAHHLNGDDLIAQSPRKGGIPMDDIPVPSQNEFESEIVMRPSELADTEPYEATLKETMHQPEKEQASPMEPFDNSALSSADIRSSIYDNTLGKIEDVMNKVQLLPVGSDAQGDISINDSIMANGSLIMDKNLNGDGSITADLSNLKLTETTKAVTEEPVTAAVVQKAKISSAGKLSKTPDLKKTDSRTKTSAGPKKATSTTSTNISDAAGKPKPSTAISKTKVGTNLSARPRTAPVSSSKPAAAASSTEKKSTTTNIISARARPDSKVSPTTGLKKAPLTKPATAGVESKLGSARPTTASKVASTTKTLTARTASTTSTTTSAKRTLPLSNTTSSASSGTKPTTGRLALSPSSKPLTSTSKPAISPRSTVTSTLRKTEAVKSPTGARMTVSKTTTTTTTKTAPKPTTTTQKTTAGTTTITKRMSGTTTTTTTSTTKLSAVNNKKPSTTSTSKTTTTMASLKPATKKPAAIGSKKTASAIAGLKERPVDRKQPIEAAPVVVSTVDEEFGDILKMNGSATTIENSDHAISIINGENGV